MIELSQADHPGLCYGWIWTIQDEDALAKSVALVALGYYRHIYKILGAINIPHPKLSAEKVSATKKFLSVAQGETPWHRDGWIFQAISWIAALKQATDQPAITRPPQIIKADKGFDGLQLKVSADGLIINEIVIFEDKATENPRDTIRKEVWIGIDEIESGARSAEITHGASALMEAHRHQFPAMDIDGAIDNILWKERSVYRISITVGEAHSSSVARARLFSGFDGKAPGAIARRRAETIQINELRLWMESFAHKVIFHVEDLGNV